jgi:hypothetical protein
MSVLFLKDVFGKKRRKVLGGVLGGYCRGTMMVQSTWRVLPRKGIGHVLIDHRCSWKINEFPLP